jgi:hypothetical protein
MMQAKGTAVSNRGSGVEDKNNLTRRICLKEMGKCADFLVVTCWIAVIRL